MIPAVLAIDGGNSKTDVLLLADDGSVLAAVRGPGASPQRVGVERCLDTLADLGRQAHELAGSTPGTRLAEHTAACLAGADLPREEQALRAAVAQRRWSDSVTVDNDTFALLRAGTATGVGVAVVCGAGINSVGVAPDGRVARFPALGRISGDWGGGAFLGSEALWWAVRAEDGRGPRTALLPAVLEHFGVGGTDELIEALHFGDVPAVALQGLCPVLFDVAESGDEVASSLVEQLVDELARMATVSLRRLDMLDEPAEVVLGGGVLVGKGRRIVPDVARRCAEVAPRCVVTLVDVPPVVGAGLLGLDRLHADDEAFQRLRHWAGTATRTRGGPEPGVFDTASPRFSDTANAPAREYSGPGVT